MFQIMVLSTCVALHVSKVPYKTKAPYQSLGEEGARHPYRRLWAGKPRCREVKWFAQAHTMSQCQLSDQTWSFPDACCHCAISRGARPCEVGAPRPALETSRTALRDVPRRPWLEMTPIASVHFNICLQDVLQNGPRSNKKSNLQRG